MSTILRLLIVVPIGFVFAVIAAGLTVALGIFGLNPSSGAAGWILIFTAWTAAYAGAFAFMPWLIAVVFAEGFGFRSVFYWFAVGGGIGARGLCSHRILRRYRRRRFRPRHPPRGGICRRLRLLADRRAELGRGLRPTRRWSAGEINRSPSATE